MTDAKATGAALKEKVDAEAAQAEAEEPETEETEPVEPKPDEDPDEEEEAETEPVEPASSTRRQPDPGKQLDNAFRAFGKKLMAIFEVDEIEPVQIPGLLGFMMPGFAEPRTHENFRRCTTCNGLGKILTTAQTGDPAKDWHVCPDPRCKGNGFWQKQASQPEAPLTGPLAVTAPPAAEGEWGEAPSWMGDPTLTAGQ